MLYLTTKTGSTTTSRPYYYILNLQGDVVHLVNTAGKAMASYTYDPYGAILTKSGEFADLNPIRYRGYYYDTETGFYYLQSRYYDPALGRFINADSYASTGQGYLGYNMFAYCNNNPVISYDPTGHRPVVSGLISEEVVKNIKEIVETVLGPMYYAVKPNSAGEMYEYWLDMNKQGKWVRHNSNHGNPKKHSNPHDHKVIKDDDDNDTLGPLQAPNSGFKAPEVTISTDNDTSDAIRYGATTVGVGLTLWVGVKWIAAIALAPETGCGSLAVAAAMP